MESSRTKDNPWKFLATQFCSPPVRWLPYLKLIQKLLPVGVRRENFIAYKTVGGHRRYLMDEVQALLAVLKHKN